MGGSTIAHIVASPVGLDMVEIGTRNGKVPRTVDIDIEWTKNSIDTGIGGILALGFSIANPEESQQVREAFSDVRQCIPNAREQRSPVHIQ